MKKEREAIKTLRLQELSDAGRESREQTKLGLRKTVEAARAASPPVGCEPAQDEATLQERFIQAAKAGEAKLSLRLLSQLVDALLCSGRFEEFDAILATLD